MTPPRVERIELWVLHVPFRAVVREVVDAVRHGLAQYLLGASPFGE